MKIIRQTVLTMTVLGMMHCMSSCSSDPNPIDFFNTPHEKAYIQLDLSVSATRASDALATDEELKINKVNIYIFGEDAKLETVKKDQTISEDSPFTLESTSGLKTIYAISAKSELNPAEGTSIADFEKTLVSSKNSDLITDDGFVMIGKSQAQYVTKSATVAEMPHTNVFNIELVRLAAKVQVKSNMPINETGYGFYIGTPEFRVCQTNDKMRIVPNGVDVITNYTSSIITGTYDGYSWGSDSEYIPSQKNGFTNDNCRYMSENIVNTPVAGNITFLSIRVANSPSKFYSYAENAERPTQKSGTPMGTPTFYVVGMVDETHGFSDYTVDPTNHFIYAFEDEADANRYRDALNGGKASSVTVSETDAPLRAPSVTDGNDRQFRTLKFDKGYSYYRVNITQTEDGENVYKVERNKFYKISINSFKTLGFHSEEMLRPTDPEADVDSQASSWIGVTFNVVDWDSVDQSVDL